MNPRGVGDVSLTVSTLRGNLSHSMVSDDDPSETLVFPFSVLLIATLSLSRTLETSLSLLVVNVQVDPRIQYTLEVVESVSGARNLGSWVTELFEF